MENISIASRSINSSLASKPSSTPDGTDLYANLKLRADKDVRDIRILELEPLNERERNENLDPSIRGTLRVVPLSSSPRFTALSYVWGQQDSTYQYFVYIGTHKIEVTANCIDALKRIRRRYGRISIWVDAICINQADVAERSQQVALMGEIYTFVHTVHIWLGRGNEWTQLAIDILNECSYYWLLAECMPRNCFLLKQLREKITQSLGKPSIQEKLIKEGIYWSPAGIVDDFFSLPWFGRGWTFQEIILATNPIVLCGEQEINFVRLVAGCFGLGYPGETDACVEIGNMMKCALLWSTVSRPTKWNDTQIRKPVPERPWRNSSFIPVIFEMWAENHLLGSWPFKKPYPNEHARRLFSWKFRNSEFDSETDGVLIAIANRQVRKAKDKSYAMYGVLDAFGVALHRPDYDKPEMQIYQELFSDLVSWDRRAIALLEYSGLPIEPHSPSWVPHLDQPPAYIRPTKTLEFTSTREEIDASLEDQILTVKGKFSDRIVFCVSVREFSNPALGAVSIVLGLASRCTQYGCPIDDGSFRQILLRMTYNLTAMESTITNHYDQWLEIIEQNCFFDPTEQPDSESITENSLSELRHSDPGTVIEQLCANPIALDYHTKLTRALDDVKVFATEKCSIGVANAGTQVDDEIFFMKYFRFDFIVRKVTLSQERIPEGSIGCYNFVGSAEALLPSLEDRDEKEMGEFARISLV